MHGGDKTDTGLSTHVKTGDRDTWFGPDMTWTSLARMHSLDVVASDARSAAFGIMTSPGKTTVSLVCTTSVHSDVSTVGIADLIGPMPWSCGFATAGKLHWCPTTSAAIQKLCSWLPSLITAGTVGQHGRDKTDSGLCSAGVTGDMDTCNEPDMAWDSGTWLLSLSAVASDAEMAAVSGFSAPEQTVGSVERATAASAGVATSGKTGVAVFW